MPAKKKITREKILNEALEMVREGGLEKVNCLDLAKRLGCSTQPIYLSFANMEDLKGAILSEISAVYETYLKRETEKQNYPRFKAYGMGYIRFAREEKEFYKCLFLRDRSKETVEKRDEETENIVSIIAETTGLSKEQAYTFHIEMWIYVHGIATMLATSYLDWNEETVSSLISDMYAGLKARYSEAR